MTKVLIDSIKLYIKFPSFTGNLQNFLFENFAEYCPDPDLLRGRIPE